MNHDESRNTFPMERIEGAVYVVRGQNVLFDRDLAALYGVKTKILKQAVRRNSERFPQDFAFELTKSELENWRSQFVTSNSADVMGLRYTPIVFTEQGVAMLSSVLRSPQAVRVNIEIMRTFVRLRKLSVSHENLSKELRELKSFVLKYSNKTDREFQKVWRALEKMTALPKPEPRKIGFDVGE